MVDPDKVYEIIDEVRAQYPDELKQARWIVKERQEMLEEAEKEANRILEEARDRAQALANETEVVRLAEAQAADILDKARTQEREIRLGAEDYADEMLANLEVNLGKLLTAVQRGRDRLQGKVGGAPAPVAPRLRDRRRIHDGHISGRRRPDPRGARREHRGHRDDLAFDTLQVGAEMFAPTGPAHFDVTITNTGTAIIAMGTVTLPVLATCARCLVEFPTEIAAEVDGFYVAPGHDEGIPEEQEIEYIDAENHVDILPGDHGRTRARGAVRAAARRGVRRHLPDMRRRPQRRPLQLFVRNARRSSLRSSPRPADRATGRR